MVVRVLALLGLMLINSVVVAQGLSATVDRAQLGLGEQLEFTLSLSGVTGQRPDMSGLLKDFSIDRQSQSTSMNYINGVVSRETRWVFLLSPNRKGKLVIPAFKVYDFSSEVIDIVVTDMPVAQSTSDDVLMEVELTPKNPYINSQLAYIQRLYYSRPLVDNASISKPKLSVGDADIQFWGSSDPRHVTHNNRPYRLMERYFIIYPRQSGPLEFEPSVFNGSLAKSRQRNDFQMNGFRMGAKVRAYSKKASVEVKEKPASYPSENWLPASRLTLSVSYSQPVDTLKVGEPLTVTIALMAEGLKAEVLPEVLLDLPEAIKSYPEKPRFQTDKASNGMVGLRQEKVVLIANEAGEYLIPEVAIPWWSTTEDQLKFAKLAPVVLKVAGSGIPLKASNNVDNGVDQDLSNSLVNDAAEKEDEVPIDEVTIDKPLAQRPVIEKSRLILIGLLLLVAMMALGIYGWRVRRTRRRSSKYLQQQVSVEALKALEVACRTNDIKAATAALPAWASSVGMSSTTLSGIEAEGGEQLRSAIRAMTEAGYSPEPFAWHGESLLEATNHYASASKIKHVRSSGLGPLHPV